MMGIFIDVEFQLGCCIQNGVDSPLFLLDYFYEMILLDNIISEVFQWLFCQ